MSEIHSVAEDTISNNLSPTRDTSTTKLEGSDQNFLDNSTTIHLDQQFEKRSTVEQPDGGYGWIIVLAACLSQIPSQGVMQSYYEQHQFSVATVVQLSFVGTLANLLLNSLGPLTQSMLTLLSSRTVLWISVALSVLGLELASFSTEVWHLYLAHGIVFGAGASMTFYIAMSAVPSWFTKREGLALAFASTGSCIGGIAIPLLMASLNKEVGASWCYRILGLITIVVGGISYLLLKERNPEPKRLPTLKELVPVEILNNFNFMLWCLADILMEGGYYIPFFYLPSNAEYLGLSANQGSILIAFASAANLFGRLVAGALGDKLGHINIVIIYSAVTSLSCFLVWNFAETFSILMVFSSLFGFCGGSFIALTPSIINIVCGKEKLHAGLSLFLILTLISMFSPNLAGAVEQQISSERFLSYKLFTGTAYGAGTIVMITLKLRINLSPFSKL